jgi:four helix bundle protein
MKEFDIKKRTYNFSKDLLTLTRVLDKNVENQVLSKQVIRSGTSIGANVAESKGGVSKKDFAHYFSIALKSANETDYWLRLLIANNRKHEVQIGKLIEELGEITKVIAKIVINSRRGLE